MSDQRQDCGVCGVPTSLEQEVTSDYSVPRCATHFGYQPYQAESRLARILSSGLGPTAEAVLGVKQ